MISLIADELSKMTKRQLFEQVKSLDESISGWHPEAAEDENKFLNVRALMISDYNDHYQLLFRRMFRKHRFFYRINPDW